MHQMDESFMNHFFVISELEAEFEELLFREEEGYIYDGSETDLPFEVTLTFCIQNTGKMDGNEAVRVSIYYLQPSLNKPVNEFMQFDKVFLKAGETKQVQIHLSYDVFGIYQEEKDCFVVEAGEYEILIGTSSGEMKESAVVEVLAAYCYA